MADCRTVLNIIEIIAAFGAAGFWFAASIARVKGVSDADNNYIDTDIDIAGTKLIATARLQANLNAIAAICAGVAAIAQGWLALL